nr:diguanylate cyclase [Azospirillum sp. SYSU D00513]
MVYGVLIRHASGRALISILTGLLFGVGAILVMTDPVELMSGLIVDGRTIMVGLATPFGGVPAGLIAGVLAGAYRAWLGGAGAMAGVFGIGIALLSSILFHRLASQREGGYSLKQLVLLGSMVAASGVNALILPQPIMFTFLNEALVPLTIANISGIVILGTFLSRERLSANSEKWLRSVAFTDSLTGLSNRRAFLTALRGSFQDALKYNRPFSLLLIDCDNFKKVNDTYGHECGDKTLIHLARIFEAEIGQHGVVGRFGGEEFTMLLQHDNKANAILKADHIRKTVEDAALHTDEDIIHVTVSIGVTTWSPIFADAEDMLRSADRHLYKAKERGRNCVEPTITHHFISNNPFSSRSVDTPPSLE